MLLYNKRLVTNSPATWTQLIATAKKLTRRNQYGFLYPITGGIYFNFWAYSGYGAYVFGSKGGTLDTTDVGLDNAGAVQALTFIKSLTTLMPANADYSFASSYFQSGRAAMTIDGQVITARYEERLPTLKAVPGFTPNALQVASEE